jgi:hypothetical protein
LRTMQNWILRLKPSNGTILIPYSDAEIRKSVYELCDWAHIRCFRREFSPCVLYIMRCHLFLTIGALSLVFGTVHGSSHAKSPRSPRTSLNKRQDGPVAPDTASDCTYFDTALDSSMTCAYIEDYWGISHEQFLDYVRNKLFFVAQC